MRQTDILASQAMGADGRACGLVASNIASFCWVIVRVWNSLPRWPSKSLNRNKFNQFRRCRDTALKHLLAKNGVYSGSGITHRKGS